MPVDSHSFWAFWKAPLSYIELSRYNRAHAVVNKSTDCLLITADKQGTGIDTCICTQRGSAVGEAGSRTLFTFHDALFKTSSTHVNENVPMAVWEAALEAESAAWTGDVVLAADEKLPIAHGNGLEVLHIKSGGYIARERNMQPSILSKTSYLPC